jgi:aromatic-L-amino-acid decarboxylase
VSTLHALAAAREAAVPKVREQGLAGRTDLPALRIYCSEQAHSSIDKAVLLLGFGQQNLQKIPVDSSFRMRPDALNRAIQNDRAKGLLPLAVIATVGTTATTSIDPVPAIAKICETERVWLHVDAAIAGVTAMVPGYEHVLDGCAQADSVVVNPHKWLFTPFDLSALYCRRMDMIRAAFTLTPEYLKTSETAGVTNLMDTGIQLGRRFRALKLWMILRHFGADGIRQRLVEHMRLARLFADWVDASETFECLAPVPFSVVCFRAKPKSHDQSEAALERLNANLLDALNHSGECYLSHAKPDGRYAIRLAIGNIKTQERHVTRVWELLQQHLHQLISE